MQQIMMTVIGLPFATHPSLWRDRFSDPLLLRRRIARGARAAARILRTGVTLVRVKRIAGIVLLIYVVSATAPAGTVLVLPFFNLSNTANLDWIGESFAETIRESLAAQGALTLSREERQEAFRRLSMRPYALFTRASVIKLGGIPGRRDCHLRAIYADPRCAALKRLDANIPAAFSI